MIHTAKGSDIVALMARIVAHPDRYSTVTVCSPFVDKDMVVLLIRLAETTSHVQCGLRIITSPAAAATLREALPGFPALARQALVSRMGLHAKIYLVVARRNQGHSEAIVTSIFTKSGTGRNIELGCTQQQGLSTAGISWPEVNDFLTRLAA
ncbi:MAG: hypothetical protein IPH55_06640 [Betaproteobacteria bacterium]|nr:hypothetical protein [Betaproteobacteria bacterium]